MSGVRVSFQGRCQGSGQFLRVSSGVKVSFKGQCQGSGWFLGSVSGSGQFRGVGVRAWIPEAQTKKVISIIFSRYLAERGKKASGMGTLMLCNSFLSMIVLNQCSAKNANFGIET